MKLLSKVFGRKEEKGGFRVLTGREIGEMLNAIRGFGESSSGEYVGPDTAMRAAAVFACVGVLAEAVAQLPLKLYRDRPDGGKDVARDHSLYRLLHDQPNPWMTAFEWREMGMAHLCLRGNHYAFLNRSRGGEIMEILPIPSDAVTCERNNDWSLKYTVDFGTGQGLQAVPESNMFHVRFRSLDGYRGISPIAYAREAIGLALATEKHGARLFRNGARPGGVLEHPSKMSPEAAARFKEQWQAAFSGENAHKTALLEEGMKFNALSMTSEDAQYLETRKFQTADIARIFRVPLHMIQETEKSTSWGSGIEQMTIGFTRFTLLPWLVRWEQAISRCMIGRDERDTVTPRHSVEGMERGDFKSRFAGYQIAIASGILSPNEVRALENMNPREGGDEYMSPLNMRLGGNDGTQAGDEPRPREDDNAA
jgi:HK97 family phage portal protein